MSNTGLDKLVEKRRRIDEQIRAKRARLRAEQSKQNRKDDARRKIITGALALEHASKNPDSEFSRVLMRLLREYVTEKDQHLFELPDEQADVPNDNETSSFLGRLSTTFRRSDS